MDRRTTTPSRSASDPSTASAAEEEVARLLILDHASRPRHFGSLAGADREGCAESPSCGDRYRVFVTFEGTRIGSVQFVGRGCSISMASASMMTLAVRQGSLGEVRSLRDQFQRFLTDAEPSEAQADALGELAAFAGLRRNPLRVRCATLPWTALLAALDAGTETA